MKLTLEDKIEIIELKKRHISANKISIQFKVGVSNINYIYDLYKEHGEEILKSNYHHYNEVFKIRAINRAKAGESLRSVSIKLGLSNPGTLFRWLKEYDNNYGRIPLRKRGRPPMKKNNKKDLNKSNELKTNIISSEVEKLKTELKKEKEKNLYQEAEIKYLKKLRALVQAREKQEQKKKSK